MSYQINISIESSKNYILQIHQLSPSTTVETILEIAKKKLCIPIEAANFFFVLDGIKLSPKLQLINISKNNVHSLDFIIKDSCQEINKSETIQEAKITSTFFENIAKKITSNVAKYKSNYDGNGYQHYQQYLIATEHQSAINNFETNLWFASTKVYEDHFDEENEYYISKAIDIGFLSKENIYSWTSPLGEMYNKITNEIIKNKKLQTNLSHERTTRTGVKFNSKILELTEWYFKNKLLQGVIYHTAGISPVKIWTEKKTGQDHNAISQKIFGGEFQKSGLKEIIRTIDQEQNTQIRSFSDGVIVVKGAPGTGKTTVALHRIPFLIDNQSQQEADKKYSEEKTIVIVKNHGLIDFVIECLEDLNVSKIMVTTSNSFTKKNLLLLFNIEPAIDSNNNNYLDKTKFFSVEKSLDLIAIQSINSTNSNDKYEINSFKELIKRCITEQNPKFDTTKDKTLNKLTNEELIKYIDKITLLQIKILNIFKNKLISNGIVETNANKNKGFLIKEDLAFLVINKLIKYFLFNNIHLFCFLNSVKDILTSRENKAEKDGTLNSFFKAKFDEYFSFLTSQKDKIRTFTPFTIVAVDEFQTFSPTQRFCINYISQLNQGETIFSGDPNQLIEPLAHADDYWDLDTRNNIQTFCLNAPYRFSKKILDFLIRFSTEYLPDTQLIHPDFFPSGEGVGCYFLHLTEKRNYYQKVSESISDIFNLLTNIDNHNKTSTFNILIVDPSIQTFANNWIKDLALNLYIALEKLGFFIMETNGLYKGLQNSSGFKITILNIDETLGQEFDFSIIINCDTFFNSIKNKNIESIRKGYVLLSRAKYGFFLCCDKNNIPVPLLNLLEDGLNINKFNFQS